MQKLLLNSDFEKLEINQTIYYIERGLCTKYRFLGICTPFSKREFKQYFFAMDWSENSKIKRFILPESPNKNHQWFNDNEWYSGEFDKLEICKILVENLEKEIETVKMVFG